MIRKILYGLAAVVAVIQFVRPAKNESTDITTADLTRVYSVPPEIKSILEKSCYDCHSNRTRYPWYAEIQPVGWWLNSHIQEGKEHLNFSEFGAYPAKKADHKLEEIEEAVTEGWMPLSSYVWIHRDAQLHPEQAQAIAAWAHSLRARDDSR
jgi:hypothetical protein